VKRTLTYFHYFFTSHLTTFFVYLIFSGKKRFLDLTEIATQVEQKMKGLTSVTEMRLILLKQKLFR